MLVCQRVHLDLEGLAAKPRIFAKRSQQVICYQSMFQGLGKKGGAMFASNPAKRKTYGFGITAWA